MVAAEQKLEDELRSLRGYILSVSRKVCRRSLMMGIEDVAQEGTIVLWRIIKNRPNITGDDLIRLFKTSFRNRLASLFRVGHVKAEKVSVSLDAYGKTGEEDVNAEDELDVRIVLTSVRNVLPWDFYKVSLKRLGRQVGFKVLRALIDRERRGMKEADFQRRKEELLPML